MITNLVSFFQVYWPCIKDFFNSTFFIAIAGAFAGAFAGAYIAQKIAENNKNRDELIKEIRNTNAAVILAMSICNSFIGLKRQQVKELKEKFDQLKARFLQFHAQRNNGQIGKEVAFEFEADLRSLSLLPLPMAVLQQQMFEKLSLSGRPLSLQLALVQTAHALNEFVDRRNRLIEGYKGSPHSPDKLASLYFGLRDQSGHINEEYPSCLNAIHSHTDDGIFFSLLLCDDLALHGKQLEEKFAKQFGRPAPKAVSSDFSKAKELGLIPDAAPYSDWITGFVQKEAAFSRWERLKRKVLRRRVADQAKTAG